jgi:hypothetical protein
MSASGRIQRFSMSTTTHKITPQQVETGHLQDFGVSPAVDIELHEAGRDRFAIFLQTFSCVLMHGLATGLGSNGSVKKTT